MRTQSVIGAILSLALLLLVAGPGVAEGPQPAVREAASDAAHAPWFTVEVDTPGNTGQHASLA